MFEADKTLLPRKWSQGSCGATIVGHFICFSFGVIDADKVSGTRSLSGLCQKFYFKPAEHFAMWMCKLAWQAAQLAEDARRIIHC
jgi:hypothetical protein